MLRLELVVLAVLKARRRLTKIGLQAKHVKMATIHLLYQMQKTTVLRAMTKILRQARSSGIFLLRYPTPRTTVHKQGINLPRKTKLQTTTLRPYLTLKITATKIKTMRFRLRAALIRATLRLYLTLKITDRQAKIRHRHLAHLQEM